MKRDAPRGRRKKNFPRSNTLITEKFPRFNRSPSLDTVSVSMVSIHPYFVLSGPFLQTLALRYKIIEMCLDNGDDWNGIWRRLRANIIYKINRQYHIYFSIFNFLVFSIFFNICNKMKKNFIVVKIAKIWKKIFFSKFFFVQKLRPLFLMCVSFLKLRLLFPLACFKIKLVGVFYLKLPPSSCGPAYERRDYFLRAWLVLKSPPSIYKSRLQTTPLVWKKFLLSVSFCKEPPTFLL